MSFTLPCLVLPRRQFYPLLCKAVRQQSPSSSLYRRFCRLLLLFPVLGCHYVSLLVHLLSSVLERCPAHFDCYAIISMISMSFKIQQIRFLDSVFAFTPNSPTSTGGRSSGRGTVLNQRSNHVDSSTDFRTQRDIVNYTRHWPIRHAVGPTAHEHVREARYEICS